MTQEEKLKKFQDIILKDKEGHSFALCFFPENVPKFAEQLKMTAQYEKNQMIDGIILSLKHFLHEIKMRYRVKI